MKTNRAKFLPLMRKFFYKQISQPMFSFLQQMTTATRATTATTTRTTRCITLLRASELPGWDCGYGLASTESAKSLLVSSKENLVTTSKVNKRGSRQIHNKMSFSTPDWSTGDGQDEEKEGDWGNECRVGVEVTQVWQQDQFYSFPSTFSTNHFIANANGVARGLLTYIF